MTGLPGFNFPAFHEAAERWRKAGWEVISPAEEFEGRTDLPREKYLRRDIENLLRVDGIALLPGWADSKGARLELAVAQELGLNIFNAHTMAPALMPTMIVAAGPYPGTVAPTQQDAKDAWVAKGGAGDSTTDPISLEAHRLVYGDRNKSYGHPFDDYFRTSRMWEAFLGLEQGSIGPYRAALMMALMKASRAGYQFKRDSLVDLAGYAECAFRIHLKEEGVGEVG
jgi:hypothetical protein